MAELGAEAACAANQSAVEHDTRAESGTGRQYDEGAGAPRDAEAPLRERERVDVVVDERRQSKTGAQRGREWQAGQWAEKDGKWVVDSVEVE